MKPDTQGTMAAPQIKQERIGDSCMTNTESRQGNLLSRCPITTFPLTQSRFY